LPTKQGADRREPGVSRASSVAALALEIVQEPADELEIEIREIEVRCRFAGPLLGEREQELERVALRRRRRGTSRAGCGPRRCGAGRAAAADRTRNVAGGRRRE
jgi:hypothetical protein